MVFEKNNILKNILKRVFISPFVLILAAVVFYLGAEAGYQTKYRLELWKNYRATEKFNQSIIEMFKSDTYGGKTPEETFNMFVEALKNEDVDLAVKYFVLDPDRRANFWNEFNDLKQQGKLKEYIEMWPEFENWERNISDKRNDWENRAEIYYSKYIDKPFTVYDPLLKKETTVNPGEYIQERIIFTKSSNNIWKIENL